MIKRKYFGWVVFVLLAATLALSACQSSPAEDAPVETEQPEATAEPEAPADESDSSEPATVDEPEEPASVTTIGLAEAGDLGQILVDGEGYTLYVFMNDSVGTSNCYDNCAESWPPLLAEGEVAVGNGLDSDLIGTTTRDDGTTQVTYNGRPLYYFYDDNNVGDVNGQGSNDVWYVVSAAGEAVGATQAGESPAEDDEEDIDY